MAEKKEKAKKTSWFKGLKAEFKKIIWPDKKTLAKQTVAAVSYTHLLCMSIHMTRQKEFMILMRTGSSI